MAFTLLLNDLLIDFACRYVVVTMQCDVQKSLIIAQIQIDLTAIVENIDFA
jgi:hypothetical protein